MRLIHTFRTAEGLPRAATTFAMGTPPLCASLVACPVDALRGWLKGRCPLERGCAVETAHVLSHTYQKLVDTAIAADAVWYASTGHALAIVSSDEDMIPALITARSFGVRTAWVAHTETVRPPYDATVAASGVECLAC